MSLKIRKPEAFLIALALAVFLGAQPAAAATCENLQSLVLPNTTITAAESVSAGAFAPPAGGGRGGANNFRDLPAFCRVAVTLRPSSDSEIKSEIWLPANGWNGKFQMFGNGAWAGSIGYNDLANGVRAGYASASTDTGHTNGGPAFFAVGHPEKVIDFSYRAVHETTVAAKAFVSSLYGNAPKFSYFNGCSTGGRMAMAAVQRFPQDYDGIIGGSLVFPTHTQGAQVWTGVMAHKAPGGAGLIPDEKLPLIKQAALNACDGADGVRDGVIENPLQCKFDPGVLQCSGSDAANCLTAAQVQTARNMYAGPKDSRGQPLYPGAAPGSEMGWAGRLRQPTALAIETYQHLVFKDASWDYKTFDVEKDMAASRKVMGPVMDNDNPDIRAFIDRGGKLIMHHGWNDPGVSPYYTVNYYNNVVKAVGEERADRAVRLFMLPGVGHCGGGDGPDQFDRIGVLDRWLETGKAPDEIIASKVRNGVTERTRPLCAFPMIASYKGTGSTDDASSFVCRMP
jgi:feruloyl esterase